MGAGGFELRAARSAMHVLSLVPFTELQRVEFDRMGRKDLMPSPIGLAVKLALTPTGRRVIRRTVRAARSEEGRKLLSDARKLATGPTGRELLRQARQIAKKPVEAAKAPQTRERLSALRHRVGKLRPS